MNKIKVDRQQLLHFMNSGDKKASGHHTAMTGLMGEPLAVGFILHYLRSQGRPAELVAWKVTPGTRKGSRLDAWVSDGAGTPYQTEIKMWAGNAIGGLRLNEGLTPAELSQRGQKQWLERIWNASEQTFYAPQVGKVLGKMSLPPGIEAAKVEPLVCLWWLVAADDNSEAWFTLPLQEGRHPPFKQVHVFSLTRYLVGLPDELLELEVPRLAERLDWIERIFPGALKYIEIHL